MQHYRSEYLIRASRRANPSLFCAEYNKKAAYSIE
jgi:hypothetical protein